MNIMKSNRIFTSLIAVVIAVSLVLFGYRQAFAHCDGTDGPVVKAAQMALETGNVNLALIWVQKNNDDEIKNAFQKTLAVRKLSPEAKALADTYFFETVVRIHRVGEGAAYTGLKPAGRDLCPAIPATDKALESGLVEPLLKFLTDTMRESVCEQYKNTVAKKNFNKDNVNAGREYVKAYVAFVHYTEGLYEAARNSTHNRLHESDEAKVHEE